MHLAEAFQAGANTTLAPNSHVTVTGGALYSRTFVSDPDLGDVFTQTARVDGSISLTPTPAISAAATISHVVLGPIPSTYATMFLTYSPLRGELQLSVAYSRTLDVENQATTANFTPALRWNLRPGVTLNAFYTAADVSSPVVTTRTRTVGTNLLITL